MSPEPDEHATAGKKVAARGKTTGGEPVAAAKKSGPAKSSTPARKSARAEKGAPARKRVGDSKAAKPGAEVRAAPGGATPRASAVQRPQIRIVRPLREGDEPDSTAEPATDPQHLTPEPVSQLPGRAAQAEDAAGPKIGADSRAGTTTPDEQSHPAAEAVVSTLVGLLRAAAQICGLSGEEAESQVARGLAFLRRRLAGDYTVDEFGFDPDLSDHVVLPALRVLYRSWFRVEVRGIENLPADGAALVVANHSGTIAFDSLMTMVAVHDQHPAHRRLRMLGADLLFANPVVGELARKTGSTLAASPDAERLLSGGELVGVWPEGFKGIGKPFRERYKLQRFGRGGFVSAALRTGAPIVPCSIVGAEETYPILGNLPALAKLFGLPYLPVTPTFPWLGPLGLVPLPSKWIIEFGPPVQTQSFGAKAAEDQTLTFELTDQIRETIQQTLYSLLMQRRSAFF